MLPHFGEYVVLKLNPIASLKSLNDPEVLKACEALESKTYVACVINLFSFPLPGAEYVSLAATLVSQGLPNGDLGRFITSDMSVPIFPNTCNPVPRPPMRPSNPLPWSDCYHPTQATIKCRIQNDTNIGDPWPEPKHKLDVAADRLRLAQYFSEDADRRDVLRLEQDVLSSGGGAAGRPFSGNQTDEHRISDDTFPVWFEQDECCQSGRGGISYPAGIGSEDGQTRLSTASRKHFTVSSFLRRLFAKFPRLSHSPADPYDDGDDISTLSFDQVVATDGISRRSPTDSMPVVIVSNDLESVQQVNDPWDFFRELDALKKIEAEYYERVKAKTC
ncbi:hypothetical protein DFS33DRAFT_1451874 [Desarmillaria ectypa]|nr:hypothetical protein DFS33DRAFT_1451874 [Desarmillaria ectypa]